MDEIVERGGGVRGELFGTEVKRRLLFGSLALSAGYYDRYYGRALKVRRLIADQLEAALGEVHFLLLPTAAGVAFPLGESQDEPFEARFAGHSFYSDMATCLANLAGLPALSVPYGSAEALPLGVQLMGAARADRQVLKLAEALAGSGQPPSKAERASARSQRRVSWSIDRERCQS